MRNNVTTPTASKICSLLTLFEVIQFLFSFSSAAIFLSWGLVCFWCWGWGESRWCQSLLQKRYFSPSMVLFWNINFSCLIGKYIYIFSIIYKHSATQTYLIMRWWLKIINHFYKRAEKKITNLSNILINTHTHSGDILRAYSLFINHIFLHFFFCCLYHIFSRCSNFS